MGSGKIFHSKKARRWKLNFIKALQKTPKSLLFGTRCKNQDLEPNSWYVLKTL